MHMLDTNVCIDFMRGRTPVLYEAFRASDPHLFAISAVVEAELLLGAAKSQQPRENRQLVECFLAPFNIVPFDSLCAAAYARIRNQLERAGTPIGPNDTLIAATACAHEATLVTNNVREFKRVEGLVVETWDEVAL